MTILQALQSLTEYENDNLLSKVLADNGLTPSDTYASLSHKNKVASASADLYEAMAALPEFKDGNSATKWTAKILLSQARQIRKTLGIKHATISGKAIW